MWGEGRRSALTSISSPVSGVPRRSISAWSSPTSTGGATRSTPFADCLYLKYARCASSSPSSTTAHAQKMVPQISIEPPPFVVYTDEVGRRVDDAARCAGRVGSDSSDETVDASSRRSAICGSAARVFWGERSAPAIEGEGRPDGGLSRVRHDVSLLTKSEHAELWPSQSFAVR